MSFVSETEHSELKGYDETYYIDCPYCGEKSIEVKDICSMPWGEDDELDIICPECNNTFSIRPKYKFQGFFVYTDDDVELKEDNE